MELKVLFNIDNNLKSLHNQEKINFFTTEVLPSNLSVLP